MKGFKFTYKKLSKKDIEKRYKRPSCDVKSEGGIADMWEGKLTLDFFMGKVNGITKKAKEGIPKEPIKGRATVRDWEHEAKYQCVRVLVEGAHREIDKWHKEWKQKHNEKA